MIERNHQGGEKLYLTDFGITKSLETHTLMVSKRDHRAQNIRVDMTRGEVEFNVELERRHPFGQIDSLGDR